MLKETEALRSCPLSKVTYVVSGKSKSQNNLSAFQSLIKIAGYFFLVNFLPEAGGLPPCHCDNKYPKAVTSGGGVGRRPAYSFFPRSRR